MKETKTKKIEVRLTPEEKELFKEWCEERGYTVSEFIRDTINKAIYKEEKQCQQQ